MPCGTPESTGISLDIFPSSTTFIVLPVRIFLAIQVLCLHFHNGIIYFRSFEWGTVSNALLKSNTVMSVWVPVLKEEKRSGLVVRSCVPREKPALKPWWRSVRMLCPSR